MVQDLEQEVSFPYPTRDMVPSNGIPDVEIGNVIAEYFKDAMNEGRMHIPPEGRYLALAAGSGHPELHLAKRLDIADGQMVFVDRKFQEATRQRLEAFHPKISLKEMDLFDFRREPDEELYHLVTVLGAEFIFERSEKTDEFIAIVSNIMSPGGVLVIAPFYGSRNSERSLRSNGFSPLFPETSVKGSTNMLIYSFHPPVSD